MQRDAFEKPVRVAFGPDGDIRKVSSALEAAELLLDDRWPGNIGRGHLAARKACHDVIAGLKKASVARKAFQDAAIEADICIEHRSAKTTRARKEAWIGTYSGRAFDDALTTVVARQPSLSFFTDEQIEAIVSEMVHKARWQQSFRAEQRRALDQRQRQ